jgi:carbon-monoxide dehydrogenase medium subunit
LNPLRGHNVVKDFTYLAPTTLKAALALLAEHKGKVKVLAGGTDLMLQLQGGMFAPDYVVDVKNVPELNTLTFHAKTGLTIGAATSLRSIETSAIIGEKYPHLATGASEVGSVQIRNQASFGGNICTATPSADGIPALVALDATARIASVRGERTVALADFFKGVRKTVLEPDELLVDLHVAAPAAHTSGCYVKLNTRPQMDLAIVGVATTVTLTADGKTIKSAAICLGAVATTPIRIPEAEALLAGKPISEELLASAGAAAARAARPISDVRASAEYRKEQCDLMTRRSLRVAIERARAAA